MKKITSILFIMLNYPKVSVHKSEELSELNFSNIQNNNLKKEILDVLSNQETDDNKYGQIQEKHNELISKINNHVILKNILKNKNLSEKTELLEELILELKEMNRDKELEFLENKVVKDLDENSYHELLKLKSQLNRE